MWKQFNFKWDKRTLYNVMNFPILIFIRIPLVLFFWGIEWIKDRLEIIIDKLPAWEVRDTVPTEWY